MSDRKLDWLRLIAAETEGDLQDIEKTTDSPEILEAIRQLREMSADEEMRALAEKRERELGILKD